MGEAARKEEESKFVMVGPGAAELPDAGAPARTEDLDEKPTKKDDERLGSGRDPEEPDDDRRETARDRRERKKRSEERRRVETQFYRSRNEELEQRLARVEGRTSQAELTANEQRIAALKTQISNAGRVMTDAIQAMASGDKEARTHHEQAMTIRDELRTELTRLEFQKEQQSARAEQMRTAQAQQTQAPQQEPLDPTAKRLGRRWIRDHDWFDPHGTDEDSEIVLLIEERLRKEGYDASDEEMWDELEERVRKRLPHRFNGAAHDDDNDEDEEIEARPRKQERPRGPRFSSGGRERPLKKGEVYVSAERKEAMKLAGAWDDPVLRQRLLKRYDEMDARIAAERGGG